MSALQIIPLSSKPEFAPTCAAWSFGSWGCHIEDSALSDVIHRYQERALNINSLPLVWVGLIKEKIIGMISLKKYDHEDRPELSPWLGSVFVHPSFRNKGYASQLIQKLHDEARNLNYKKLYLFTSDTEKLYTKNGWKTVDQVRDPVGLRDQASLMEIEL